MACSQVCPKSCISFMPDEQGFAYPKVNLDDCINCGQCEAVCPELAQTTPNHPISTIAAINKDRSIQKSSSSGGIFYALAKQIIQEGGIVFGAKFNNEWDVIHDYTDNIEGLKDFQGSKYVQSYIGNSFKQVQKFLQQGKKVLFSGTPCHILGLKKFLRKDWGDHLITIDVVCHGVPSPQIWQKYLSKFKHQHRIININFRDKELGWENYLLTIKSIEKQENSTIENNIVFENKYDNLYLKGFLSDVFLRPSCYKCPAKNNRSGSDITLGDFWGIRNILPQFYNLKGVSLTLINTPAGKEIFNKINNIESAQVNYDEIINYNRSIIKSQTKPSFYYKFWKRYYKNQNLKYALKTTNPSIVSKITFNIKHIILKSIGRI